MSDDILLDLQRAAERKWKGDPACQQAGLFARAAEEIEGLRKDAERYRWLKRCGVGQLDKLFRTASFTWDDTIDSTGGVT